MTFLISALSFVLVFIIVALAHELGHFIWAKRAGIKVLEFGIGFGPTLFKSNHNGTIYSVNLIPILAFVRLAGIDELEQEKGVPANQQYGSKSPAEKFKSIVAGPLMNLLLGFILYSLLAMTYGMPYTSNIIGSVSKGSPAQKAGLQIGDKIVRFGGEKVLDMNIIIAQIHQSAGKNVSLTVIRNGKEVVINAVPRYDKKLKVGLLGFSPQNSYKRYGPFEAVFEGGKKTLYVSYMIVVIFGQLLTGKIAVTGLAGPIGIAQFSGQAAMLGAPSFLSLVAFISINLGVFNLLPIPALDGGRLVFILIEAVRKKPIKLEIENKIHQWGLVVLLAFFAFVSFNDIWRIFSK
ncbi:MAG: RIP metalloprotease RseP [Candidatus Margulisiibacteriota bacterium]